MESNQKNKKYSPKTAADMTTEFSNDQLGENASGHGKENEAYLQEHTNKRNKCK